MDIKYRLYLSTGEEIAEDNLKPREKEIHFS